LWGCQDNGASQRNTLAVDHHHPFWSLVLLVFPILMPPFLPVQSYRR
jgi:hypothetical protein